MGNMTGDIKNVLDNSEFGRNNELRPDNMRKRRDNIDAEFAAGNIDADQHAELIADEDKTSSYNKLRYFGLAAICITVGFLYLLSST